MNRPCFYLSMFIIILSTGNCRKDNPTEKESGAQSYALSKNDSIADSIFLDALFDTIRQRQNALIADPTSKKNQQALMSVAVDTTEGCIYTVGKNTSNMELPESSREPARTIAAKYAALKWAWYIKAWAEGDPCCYGSPIKGKVLYEKKIRSRIQDDTLIVMLKIPIGSVISFPISE